MPDVWFAFFPARNNENLIKSFQELNIHPKCIRVLNSQKISEAMPIQNEAIPHALDGKDIVAVAQTGTGKTLAFGLPALTRIAANRTKGTQMLVLCPTRELAEQIHKVIEPLARSLTLSCACIYGGVNINPQIKRLRSKPTVIVATPGRLIDHINRKNVNFKNMQILTLDEADRMLDMGFLPDMKRIISHLPTKRQTMLFSATFPEEIQRKVGMFINNPVRIEIAPQSTTAENVAQGIYPVISEKKAELLQTILRHPDVASTLIFTRTKIRADRVSKKLRKSGFCAEAIHGGCTQNRRLSALKNFSNGTSNILVATDIAARGIDIKGVTHVINYDIPFHPEDYVHRIGRTARAKASGTAYTFASPGEEASIRSIEKTIGQSLVHHEWDGMAQLSQAKSHPSTGTRPKSTGTRPKKKRSRTRTNKTTNSSFKSQPSKSRRKRRSPKSSAMQTT